MRTDHDRITPDDKSRSRRHIALVTIAVASLSP
jgi:hypothetical protein